ncbi:TREM1 protein, partial [Glaucidium brasilianum]|nr:TREM1 protein [Glaucidium brasilianum]
LHQLSSPLPHLIFTGFQAQILESKERQSEGSTLYVQCPYTAQVNSYQPKVWYRVRDGQVEQLAWTTNPAKYLHTNQSTNGSVTIEDNPVHGTVFITMTNLQTEDSGIYYCASFSYSYGYLILKVILLNVFKELHAWELDSLSVQCKYSAWVRSTDVIAWCRKTQTDCKVVVRTGYPSAQRNSKALEDRTLIQVDSKRRTVTITMHKLQAQDTGVYWCGLYQHSRTTLIMEASVNVSKISAGTTLLGTGGTNQGTPSGDTPAPSSNVNFFILLSGILSILFILALVSLVTLCVRQRKRLKRRGNTEAEDIYEKTEDIAQLDRTGRIESPKDDSKDPKYVTLNFTSQLIPEDPLYCNVEPSQAHRKPKDENVEYAIIALK